MTSGLYINDVKYTKLYDYEYVRSVSQFNDNFRAIISNKSGAGMTAIDYFDDIKIYNGGTLVFRGRAHDIKPISAKGRGETVEIVGYGYMRDLMDRFAIETYTSKSRSFMVGDLVESYAPSLSTGLITTTTESLDRIIKARSAYEAILNMADEIDFDFWVDNDLELVFQPRDYGMSSSTIDYTSATITDVVVPNQATSMYNAVYVYGDPDTTGTIAYAENPASISLYGITREFPPVYDRSLKTVAECQDRAFGIVNKGSTINPVVEIHTKGYNNVDPGETVALTNFNTKFGVADGVYLCLERSQEYRNGKTVLKLSKYSDSTEDIIIDIIKRLRRVEYQELDQAQTVTKFLRVNEDLELEGYTIEVWAENLAESFIAGHPTNGKAGMQSTQIYAGLSGMTMTKPGDGTRT